MANTFVVRTQTPVRIDLAGGTIDLWPLSVIVPKASTYLLATQLFAETTIRSEPCTGEGTIILESSDQSVSKSFPISHISETDCSPALTIPLFALREYVNRFGNKPLQNRQTTISTRARSPAGAGLGGSSSLLICVLGAVERLWHKTADISNDKIRNDFIALARDLESRLLFAPSGVQDYYGAAFGGLQHLRWGLGQMERKMGTLAETAWIAKRTLLFYSGQSRNSGINNWQVFKNFIDRDANTQSCLQEIALTTWDLYTAVEQQNTVAARKAIDREWAARKRLAPGISTESLDELERAIHRANIPAAIKVCGAGGGGCFLVFVDDVSSTPKTIDAVRELATKISGLRNLPLEVAPHGLTLLEDSRPNG